PAPSAARSSGSSWATSGLDPRDGIRPQVAPAAQGSWAAREPRTARAPLTRQEGAALLDPPPDARRDVEAGARTRGDREAGPLLLLVRLLLLLTHARAGGHTLASSSSRPCEARRPE